MDTSFKSFYMVYEWLLSAVGQWPYQTKLKRICLSIFAYISIISLLIPELLGLKKYWGNVDIVIQCIPPIIVIIIVLCLLTNGIIKIEKMELIIKKMKTDWNFWTTDLNIDSLQDYVKSGKSLDLMFMYIVCVLATLYISMPITPLILNIILPLNQTRTKQSLYFTDYYLNEEKYYYWTLIHGCISSSIVIVVLVSIETMFSAVIIHACRIFSILGIKLKNIVNDDSNDGVIDKKRLPQKIDEDIKIFVKKHMEILEFVYTEKNLLLNQQHFCFVDDICDFFSTPLLVVLACNTILISVTGVQTVIKLHKFNEALRFGSFTISQIFNLLYLNIPCQQLIDHSIDISNSIYNGYWYQLSSESQKMLLMIMRRSSRPSEFTAGKLYTYSISNFASILRMSMSYFTMLSSVR
ncbi:odorant receptor 22c-like [Leptopilina boulardi]|uniref:odorant receptor 22c-like n=1 Tax=Leptopilina boulardi TaxID=63433 RepID=UPI0021F60119|nr:odorant receptor 22c-like [Leptopilina boulardi]